jgi:hypothetical protein
MQYWTILQRFRSNEDDLGERYTKDGGTEAWCETHCRKLSNIGRVQSLLYVYWYFVVELELGT